MKENKHQPFITPKTVFGVRTEIPNNVQFFGIDKCAFMAGNYIVITTVKDKAQFFFPGLAEGGEITSYGVDEFNDTILLAIGHKTSEGKSVIFLRSINKLNISQSDNEKKGIRLNYAEMDSNNYFSSIAVSYAKNFVITLVGPKPPFEILIYQEIRGNNHKMSKLTLTLPIFYKHVNINPYNQFFISAHGDGGFAVFNFSESEKKGIQKLEVESKTFNEFSNYNFNIVSCTWVSLSRVALMNVACDIFVLDFSFKTKIDISSKKSLMDTSHKNKIENPYKKLIKSSQIFENNIKEGRAIFSKGGNLYICKEDGMIVKMEDKLPLEKNIQYEKSTNMLKFVPNSNMKVSINSISFNNSSNTNSNFWALMLSTNDSQLLYMEITNDNTLSDGNNYKYYISQFHSDEIICLDVCKLKQLVATCGKDKYIRIWNYINLQMENSYESSEEDDPKAISFHPTGLHLAVLLKDKFRLMHILEKGIVTYKELTIFQPNDIRFSNLGHMFAICYKNSFQIYNFYTCEIIFNSKSSNENFQGHTDDVKCLTWDEDDTGFATCGLDGRAFYWQLYSNEPKVLEFYNRDYRFIEVEIMTLSDGHTKKLFLLDQNNLIEFYMKPNEKKDKNGRVIPNNLNSIGSASEIKDLKVKQEEKSRKEKPNVILQNSKLSGMLFDGETKILIVSSLKKHSPSIKIFNYNFDERTGVSTIYDDKEIPWYQANSTGVNKIKISFDMTHLFTVGKDGCIFFFNIHNVIKSEKGEDSMEPGELVLAKKEDLDSEAAELRQNLIKIENEINQETENFERIKKDLDRQIEQNLDIEKREMDALQKEKRELEEKIRSQIDFFENELEKMFEEHRKKMEDLNLEQEKNRMAKDKDKKKEFDNLKNDKNRDEATIRQLKVNMENEIKQITDNYNQRMSDINLDIKLLEEKNEELMNLIKTEKSDKMNTNDIQLGDKRLTLETLKKTYEKIKFDHQKAEEKLKSEINEIRKAIKNSETKKHEDKNKLMTLQTENGKLSKQISDMQTDKKEKEDTIVEKNNIKRELEKENQELEKFKFVLNYKIKELNHEKDPEEAKLHKLQKKAKDIEREIKNCDNVQDNYLLEIAEKNQNIASSEKEILRLEKEMEKITNYRKLFVESVQNALKFENNPKKLKKELIKLKTAFLDKEFIEVVEKPFDENPELQRHFLEINIASLKQKKMKTRNLFVQDFKKMMRENKKLLTIVNELEVEQKLIHTDNYKVDTAQNILKQNKIQLKPKLPEFNKTSQQESEEQKIALLRKQIFETEKQIQELNFKEMKEFRKVIKKSDNNIDL